MFYSKEKWVLGLRIRAHRDVSDAALDVAAARVEALLGGCEGVTRNLAEAGAELHVIGKDQAVSDLPMYRHLAGKPFEGEYTIDQRGRGYGGLHACCAEESLLRLPTARHADHRDVCSHELAHSVLMFGLDDALRERMEARYRDAIREGRWEGAYAAKNVHELFAEATMWYVGSRGDYGRIRPTPTEGPAWLAAHDPATFALLDDIYLGRAVPRRAGWDLLRPCAIERSGSGDAATLLVFVNHTDRPVERVWLDYDGARKPYGTVVPEGTATQHTYATHAWLVTDEDGRELGRWVAGTRPCRIVLSLG